MSSTEILVPNDDMIDMETDGRRKRSSSMDILAEAAVVSFSGQTSRASTIATDEEESKSSNQCEWPDTTKLKPFSLEQTQTEKNLARFELEVPHSPTPYRQRGATISYSPYTSKDPRLDYLFSCPLSRSKPALSWLANAADDEATTAELLSGLCHAQGKLTPSARTPKDDFSFGDLHYDSSRLDKPNPLTSKQFTFSSSSSSSSSSGAVHTHNTRRTATTPSDKSNLKFEGTVIGSGESWYSNYHELALTLAAASEGRTREGVDTPDGEEGEAQEEDGMDLDRNDISILTAFACKIMSDHAHDSSFMEGINISTRPRSNSLPQLPSTLPSKIRSFSHQTTVSSASSSSSSSHSRNKGGGVYTPEERQKRIERFLEKRRNRVWTKKVKYDVRKNFADSRIRVKGRFIRKQDEETLSQTTSNG